MLSAMMSGSGKTVMTTAILLALRRRGQNLISFKCGPDYIDPMYHTRVLGIPCRNLDLFLMGSRAVAEELSANGPYDLAVIEGAMGFYDGIGGTTRASAYEIVSQTNTPVLLVVRSKGQSATLAAQLCGMLKFRENPCLAGVIFTECTERLYAHLKPIVERETGLSVFGYLPRMEEAVIDSRHLGLVTAEEIEDFGGRFSKVADQLEKTADLDGILRMAEQFQTAPAGGAVTDVMQTAADPVRIAIARDEAFCFYYESSFEALRRAGAELVWFSPVRGEHFPENVHGLYLGGGYPERYAAALSENENILAAIRSARSDGMPIVAECGGFLYLLEKLEGEDGNVYPMAGVLPGNGFRTKGLRRFGYTVLQADTDSLLFRAGENVPAHSFHHWDASDPGSGFLVRKAADLIQSGESFDYGKSGSAVTGNAWEVSEEEPFDGGKSGSAVTGSAREVSEEEPYDSGKFGHTASGSAGNQTGEETSPSSGWRECFADENLYAGFPHLALGGELPLAERFVVRCRTYRDRMVR